MNYEDFKIDNQSKAIVVSIVCENFEHHSTQEETEYGLSELKELLRTLEIPVTHEIIQNRKSLDPATMVGTGKLDEAKLMAEKTGADCLVFDFELTAGQVKNIKKVTGLTALDRNSIILEIFAQNARTKEAKLQIEISRLQYLLPRLTSYWSHFTKQKGGIGLKGEGEQQLELDRRMIRKKIERYRKQLKEVEVSKKEQSKKRENQAIVAALVGYTNAGKTSLMNGLCQTNKLSENKLFATLDATHRSLNPDSKPPMLLIDTVGFISNLSSTLVEGFKTTLQSALSADLLIVVVDVSDPHYLKHIDVTLKVLEEISVEEKEKVIVFNKIDKVDNPIIPMIAKKKFINSFLVSSLNEESVKKLKYEIINYFLDKQQHFDLFVPYEDGMIHSKIQSKTNIVTTKNHEDGIYYRVRIPQNIFNTLNIQKYTLSPSSEKLLT